LPMNISRAIRPISQGLKDFSNEKVDVITPYKGSPPGIRPIFVKAESIEELAEKIIEIVDVYKPYSLLEEGQKIAILEKDNQLFRSLIVRRNNFAETDTILRLKGMEKNVVVWSTRIMIPDQEEINNFIYTIMTRTSCMLIIAICDEMCEPYKELIKQIPTDYVINWDQETKTYLDSYIYN